MRRKAMMSGTSRAFATAVLAACCATCAWWPGKHNPMATWVPSKNHNARKAILIVIHATEQESVQASLETLRTRNSGGPVSAHYLIGRDGKLYQLVRDDRRAWHAGPGSWGTITDLNSTSIGIELDNNGRDPFPEAQVQALLTLLDDLCRRHGIPRRQVIGHADIAPTRKRDPGHLFPWATLAAAGFGRWPSPSTQEVPSDFNGLLALELLGYPMDDPQAAIRAFRLHYRGSVDDRLGLDEADRRILHGLQVRADRP